jgi:hypothetical protein
MTGSGANDTDCVEALVAMDSVSERSSSAIENGPGDESRFEVDPLPFRRMEPEGRLGDSAGGSFRKDLLRKRLGDDDMMSEGVLEIG